jgi:hypothetical protein
MEGPAPRTSVREAKPKIFKKGVRIYVERARKPLRKKGLGLRAQID